MTCHGDMNETACEPSSQPFPLCITSERPLRVLTDGAALHVLEIGQTWGLGSLAGEDSATGPGWLEYLWPCSILINFKS